MAGFREGCARRLRWVDVNEVLVLGALALALAARAGPTRVEVVLARVVARDRNLVRLDTDELAHLDNLVVLVGEEEAALGHQPLLPRLP